MLLHEIERGANDILPLPVPSHYEVQRVADAPASQIPKRLAIPIHFVEALVHEVDPGVEFFLARRRQFGGEWVIEQILFQPNADGYLYAIKARTGEKVWGFAASQRGLNSSPVVDGYRVYITHSEENLDSTLMGRVICIDGRGHGDVTKTHKLWEIKKSPKVPTAFLFGAVVDCNRAGGTSARR